MHSQDNPAQPREAGYPDTSPTPSARPPLKTEKRSRTGRSFWHRAFAIDAWGVAWLILICLLVGMVMEVSGLPFNASQFSLSHTLTTIWQNLVGAILWLFGNGWWPALLGALIVLPIWAIWRLISMPFRHK